jgi:hypothetical protein
MMPNHVIEPEELMAYLDGELPVDRAADAASHLERCRECQSLAADFESVSRRMTAWQVEPSTAMSAPQLDAALAACPPYRKSRRVAWAAWGRPAAWGWLGGIAAALAAAIFFAPKSVTPKPEAMAVAQYQTAFQTQQDDAPQHSGERPGQQAGQQGRQQQGGQGGQAESVRPNPFGSASPAPPPLPQAPLIARTAQLTLTTHDVDQARAAMEEILKRHAGYLGELTFRAPSDAGQTLEATLRIPADRLSAALAELKKLGRVESESQTGEEVTQEAVDLDARLANSRNTEQRLTALLKQQTGRLADVLQVETEIARVRGEIERMESERKALAKRVDFATVHLTLAEDYKAKLQLAPDSTPTRFRNAAVEGFRNVMDTLSGLALFLLADGPSLLLWAAILFFPARFAWRKWRQARRAQQSTTEHL